MRKDDACWMHLEPVRASVSEAASWARSSQAADAAPGEQRGPSSAGGAASPAFSRSWFPEARQDALCACECPATANAALPATAQTARQAYWVPQAAGAACALCHTRRTAGRVT